MRLRIRQLSIILTLLFLAILAWLGQLCYQIWTRPMPVFSDTSIKIYPGFRLHDFADALYQKKLIQYPHVLTIIGRSLGFSGQLRYGEYRIARGMTVRDLLINITTGKGLVKHRVTFIEGWTFKQWLEALAKNPVLKHTASGLSDATIMEQVGAPGRQPEGLFFPNTYVFYWGNTDIEVLQHAYRKMQSVLQRAWAERAADLPYRTPYQALIVASLVEKETALPQERAKIAGVILLRLEKRMRLQIDPTVLYGVGKPFGAPILKTDLTDANPYNTYERYGLPPTPIDMPGLASIRAALHPEKSTYLYYVARGDGSHIFSETYKAHQAAVKRYREMESEQTTEQLKTSWLGTLSQWILFILG